MFAADTLDFDAIPYLMMVFADAAKQRHYERCRLNGCKHKLAILLAERSFPGIVTDSTFNRGRCNGNQFEATPAQGDWLRARAEEAGVSTTGKYYCKGLAEFPGDPEAWVADRHDVLKVAEKKGFKVSGDVNYTPPERAPMADVPIDPTIVDREVDTYMARDPGERRADVRERVEEMLTGRVDPNPLLVEA